MLGEMPKGRPKNTAVVSILYQVVDGHCAAVSSARIPIGDRPRALPNFRLCCLEPSTQLAFCYEAMYNAALKYRSASFSLPRQYCNECNPLNYKNRSYYECRNYRDRICGACDRSMFC